MIERRELLIRLRQTVRTNPVAVLYGPRQCGKTTIARQVARAGVGEYFDLEVTVIPLEQVRARLLVPTRAAAGPSAHQLLLYSRFCILLGVTPSRDRHFKTEVLL